MEVQRCAVRWTVGVSETVGVEMNVCWSELVSESEGVGQACSAALECCSEPKTPGGVMTRMFHRVHLKSERYHQIQLVRSFMCFLINRLRRQAGLASL